MNETSLTTPMAKARITAMRITRLFRKLTFGVLAVSFSTVLMLKARSSEPSQLVEGNTAFALDLYGHLNSGPGNLFFSPYSISTCLAMTYGGARGDTEKQMARVFRFPEGQVHSSFGELQRQLAEAEKQKGIQLTIANALWAQQGHPFLPAFLNITKTDYEANINQADFKTAAEPARGEINRWVAEKTKDRIQNILPPGSLNDATRLVLANAIYFKGIWAAPFQETETSPQPFHLTSASEVEAPLMHHFDDVKYMEHEDFQAVELPYSGNELSMVI